MYNIHCIYGKVRGPPRSACMVVLYVSHVSATTSVNKADLWKLEEVGKDEAVHSIDAEQKILTKDKTIHQTLCSAKLVILPEIQKREISGHG